MKIRLLLYFFLCFIFCFLNFLEDLQEASLPLALTEVILIFPMSFGFTLGVFYIYRRIVKTPFYLSKNELNRKLFLYSTGIVIVLLFSPILKFISLQLFNDDKNSQFFDTLFFAFFGIVGVFVFFVFSIEAYLVSEQQKNELRIKLYEVELDSLNDKYISLKNQLNPHFIFNCFSNIVSLIDKDSEKAIRFVEELSNVFRYNLTTSEELLVKLTDELKLLESYIKLQKIRHEGSLHFDIKIDASKLPFLIPPLTLEVLVENSLKHTVFDKSNPLYISIYSIGDLLVIENNYSPKAIMETESLGIGLKSIEKQFRLLGQKLPTFKIENNLFKVELSLIDPSDA
ncbi:histidine kinase [Flavobacterium sp.]|uniref:sensor histidine kinase n=1 Tax=Flavobacterium sp. TaxID=239 RepID=UPI003342855B